MAAICGLFLPPTSLTRCRNQRLIEEKRKNLQKERAARASSLSSSVTVVVSNRQAAYVCSRATVEALGG